MRNGMAWNGMQCNVAQRSVMYAYVYIYIYITCALCMLLNTYTKTANYQCYNFDFDMSDPIMESFHPCSCRQELSRGVLLSRHGSETQAWHRDAAPWTLTSIQQLWVSWRKNTMATRILSAHGWGFPSMGIPQYL